MKEEWKSIYYDLYEVSTFGRVRSKDRYITNALGIVIHYKKKILKPEITSDGHLRVVLCCAGKKKRVFVHRLVAKAFIPNPHNYMIINHKDENPNNNCVDNLEWCTTKYNNTYNDIHKRRGDKEGHNIQIFDFDHHYIETLPSIYKTFLKYGKDISFSTMRRYIINGKPYNGYYFKEI